jgi:hypothetical protein
VPAAPRPARLGLLRQFRRWLLPCSPAGRPPPARLPAQEAEAEAAAAREAAEAAEAAAATAEAESLDLGDPDALMQHLRELRRRGGESQGAAGAALDRLHLAARIPDDWSVGLQRPARPGGQQGGRARPVGGKL